jgi:pSer/pThr/pTyr-binding forkhead associated (FHA) protein
MNNNDEIFVNENTPIAQSANRRPKITSFEFNPDLKPQSPEWDDDKTEVLITTLLPETYHPILHESDGTRHTLDHFPYLIGRSNECDLQVKGRAVSRRHAEITLERGRFVLNDLNSENGVTVNGCKISRVLLDDQDEICVGDCVIVFRNNNENLAGRTLDDASKATSNATKAASSQRKTRFLFVISALCVLAVGVLFAGKYVLTANKRVAAVPVPIQSDAKQSTAEASVQGTVTPDKNQAQLERSSQEVPPTSALTNGGMADSSKGSLPSLPLITNDRSATQSVEKEKINTASVLSERRTDNKIPPRSLPLQSANKPAPPPRQPVPVVATTNRAPEVKNVMYLDSDAEMIYKEVSVQKTVLVSKTDNVKKGGIFPSTLPVVTKVLPSADKYKEVHKLYEQGNAALVQNKEAEASVLFSRYVDQAKLFWPEQSSPYQKKAIQFLATYYEKVATKADQNENYKLALVTWQKLFALNKSQRAKSVLDSYAIRAQDMYRNGLRQEYINSAKAVEYWEKTKTLVPPENPYYIKAAEKLSAYAERM